MRCCTPSPAPRGGPGSSAPMGAGHPPPTPGRWRIKGTARRVAAVGTWAAPVVALALIPKCPACVAGYVLLFTGVGLSFSAASTLRWGLIAVSVAATGFLVVRSGMRAWNACRAREAAEAV